MRFEYCDRPMAEKKGFFKKNRYPRCENKCSECICYIEKVSADNWGHHRQTYYEGIHIDEAFRRNGL